MQSVAVLIQLPTCTSCGNHLLGSAGRADRLSLSPFCRRLPCEPLDLLGMDWWSSILGALLASSVFVLQFPHADLCGMSCFLSPVIFLGLHHCVSGTTCIVFLQMEYMGDRFLRLWIPEIFFFFFKDFIYSRERGREGEREVEKHQYVRDTWIGCLLVASLTPPTGDLAHNPSHVSWLATFQFAGWH